MAKIGILGGGITGLSTAYYLRKKFGDALKTVAIFEKSSKCGGWIKTVTRTDDHSGDRVNYELGPRTMRVARTESGMNALDLIEEIGLSSNLTFVKKDHPAAKTRYIYHKEKLVKLPTPTENLLSLLFKRMEPFEKPLIFAALRDLIKRRKRLEDDDLHSFVARRFGRDVADNVIEPVVRGVCGGNPRDITVKFLLKDLFKCEQEYGSALLGILMAKFDKSEPPPTTVGYSNVALSSLAHDWAVWSLDGGMQTLPWAIEEHLKQFENIVIHKNTTVRSVHIGDFDDPENISIDYFKEDEEKNSQKFECDWIVSCIPSGDLFTILRKSRPSLPSLWKVFETMGSSADIQVTNLMWRNRGENLLKICDPAFGFLLVPTSAPADLRNLLGVTFDTCIFPQSDKTILTVMSRLKNGSEEYEIEEILSFLKRTLEIGTTPTDFQSTVLRNCIPQYRLGHYEKVDAIRKYLKAAKLKFSIAGASFDGVSVADCIFSGRRAVYCDSKNEEGEYVGSLLEEVVRTEAVNRD